MKRIKFYCEEKRGYTLFQVLEQRGIKRGYFSYQASNGVQIFSRVRVALEPEAIYLRGELVEYDTYLDISNKLTKEKILETFEALAGYKEPPKRGDIIRVRGNEDEEGDYQERIYLATIENAAYPHLCVTEGNEEAYKKGEKFAISAWAYMQPCNNFQELDNNEYLVEWED